MCDCYEGKCEGCKKVIQVHIGDFSTGRRNVSIFCPDCRTAFFDYLEKRDIKNGHILFWDRGYLFLVDRPRQVSLNE